jgi:dTMP kinase
VSDRGLFLVLEGVEGAGKSTQARMLADWLGSLHIPHRLSREPGGTPVGEAIRHVLLDSGALEVPDETELLLMLAARAAFVRKLVRPTLDSGHIMIADRFELSTLAYQGAGRGLGIEAIRPLNQFATGGLRPDLTIVFDLPVSEGSERQQRSGKGRDRIEGEGARFLEAVRAGYLKLAAADASIIIVDAAPPAARVHQTVRELLGARFPEHFPAGGG